MLNYIKNLWNPVAFWMSFIMSMIMPLIFAVFPYYLLGNGVSLENWLLLAPIRWFVAYLLVNIFVRNIAFKLAIKIFGFNPTN